MLVFPGSQAYRLAYTISLHHQLSWVHQPLTAGLGASQTPKSCEPILKLNLSTHTHTHTHGLLVAFLWKTLTNTVFQSGGRP